jgi:hypothetical protein
MPLRSIIFACVLVGVERRTYAGARSGRPFTMVRLENPQALSRLY